MTDQKPAHRYLVRDYMDGCWSEHDTMQEAEASLAQLAPQYPQFKLRVDDFGPNLDRFS
jgi:hypothetical protein